jgi:hypothetical protein
VEKIAVGSTSLFEKSPHISGPIQYVGFGAYFKANSRGNISLSWAQDSDWDPAAMTHYTMPEDSFPAVVVTAPEGDFYYKVVAAGGNLSGPIMALKFQTAIPGLIKNQTEYLTKLGKGHLPYCFGDFMQRLLNGDLSLHA